MHRKQGKLFEVVLKMEVCGTEFDDLATARTDNKITDNRYWDTQAKHVVKNPHHQVKNVLH